MVDDHIASEHDGSDREENTNVAFKITVKAKLTEIAALNGLVDDQPGSIDEIPVKLARCQRTTLRTPRSLREAILR